MRSIRRNSATFSPGGGIIISGAPWSLIEIESREASMQAKLPANTRWSSRRQLFLLALGGLALATTAALVFLPAVQHAILEEWWLHRFESEDLSEKELASGKLAGIRSRKL